MLLSIITAIDPSGMNVSTLPEMAARITGFDDVEWLLATPSDLVAHVAAELDLEVTEVPQRALTPNIAPAEVDLGRTSGTIRIIPTGSTSLEPSQVSLALAAARGRWTWIVGDADEPLPAAVRHLRDVLLEHTPRFVVGNAVISSKVGIESAHTHSLPAGALNPYALRDLWGHHDGALPFSLRAVVLETAPLRAGGGCRAIDLAEVLAPIMLADAAGRGWATEALLVHYRQHEGRTTRRLSMMHLEKAVRLEAWKAPAREEQLAIRTTFSPAWHVRMVDPAPGAWWPRCNDVSATKEQQRPDATPSLPMVSVITATYPTAGREHYITDLATSILNQTGIDPRLIEWVVQEDGNGRSCLERLDEETRNDPRVRIEYNGAQLGAAATRNLALARVRGRIVLVADDDDMLLPEACATLLHGFATTDVGWVGAGIESWDGHPFVAQNLAGVVEPHGVALAWGHPTNIFPMVHTACAFRIEVLRAIGGWGALPQAEDMSMMVAASARSRGMVLPAPVYRYRAHAEQMTGAGSFSSTEAAARMAVWRRAIDLAVDAPGQTAAAVRIADRTPAVRTSRFFVGS